MFLNLLENILVDLKENDFSLSEGKLHKVHLRFLRRLRQG